MSDTQRGSGAVTDAETNADADDPDVADALPAPTEAPVRTETVAKRTGLDESTVRSRLESLAARGDVLEVALADGVVGWRRTGVTVAGRTDGNSVVVRDAATGLVTRGRTRAAALDRLAERVDQYEAGAHLGAQVCGIGDAAISPAYLDGPSDVLDSYVRPDHVTLYADVAGEGVVAVRDPSRIDRSDRIRGFGVTARLDREAFDDVMIVSVDDVVERTRLERRDFPVGAFKVLAVPPQYDDLGIGGRITRVAARPLVERPPVLTLLWDRDDDANEPLVEHFGAERLVAFPDALSFGRRCTVCGFGNECDCDAVLYGWGLDRGDDPDA